MRSWIWLLLALTCARARAAALEVAAAASLTDAFRAIGAAYSRQTGQAVSFNFGATNELRVQIENGAPADVFAAASAEEMERAVAAKLVRAPAVFARNRLIVLVPRDNPAKIERLRDLGRPGVKLVTSQPGVPVGKYTRAMLERAAVAYGAGFRAAVAKNVVSEETNVKQVVAKVALGEADAGVCYASDFSGANAPKLSVVEVPPAFNVEASYPVAVTAAAKQPAAAQRFVDLVLSPAGQALLQAHGFLRAP